MTRLLLILCFALSFARASDVQFVVINSSETPISSIRVRPAGARLWSRELLLAGRPLQPGEADPWLIVDDDLYGAVWDVKLTTPDGEFAFVAMNLGKTPVLTFCALREIGVWILTPSRAQGPLPVMDGSERWVDPAEPEPEESTP